MIKQANNPNDIVYTPDNIAKDIVEYYQPAGFCLDPCCGEGAFLRHLPEGSDWCEIQQGRDFFQYQKKVDWIISNPPYSIYDKWLEQSFKIADNVVYLIPLAKALHSMNYIKKMREYGGIKNILVMFTGRRIKFPFGFALGCVYYKRGYKGPITLDYYNDGTEAPALVAGE
jgi:hypothetical protein